MRVKTRPRLLGVDLDGTLLDKNGQPHGSDMRALRAALEAGVRVSIVTGRLYSGTRAVADLLGLRGAVACADGSHLVQAGSHATLLHLGVRGVEATTLRGVLGRAKLALFVFAKDAIGHDLAGMPFLGYVSTWSNDVRIAADALEHEFWRAEDGVTAVVALGTREQVAEAVREIMDQLAHALLVAMFPLRRGPHIGTWALIVRAAGGTKGTALRFIAQHEGVALEDTVCVGDWVNDVPMFEVAARSFVMGQAPDEVKAKATDVLEETTEQGGGVARAVAEAFGIKAD
jgi:hydroxymethylpyrimidine pyrophosphatase-like HAD family hydrolase